LFEDAGFSQADPRSRRSLNARRAAIKPGSGQPGEMSKISPYHAPRRAFAMQQSAIGSWIRVPVRSPPLAALRPSLKRSRAYQGRLLFTAAVVATMWVLTAFSPPLVGERSTVGHALDALAWCAFIGGTALRLWAALTITGRKRLEIVSDGPYQFSRNPLYVGTALLGLALALFLKSITFGVGILGLFLVYAFAVIPAEEQYLRARHGEAYDRYCAQVPRWLPRWSNLRTAASSPLELEHRAVYAEVVRLLLWFALPLLALVTNLLRAQPNWPAVLPFS
jgi:protein-S-isoprenylcysteine O-methyltransferase Ste14